MNGVMIIPTGIGCAIGGHAGDATPAAKLMASVCDKLILHPNVVNASDINEMPPNALYVDGFLLDRFLRRETRLLETVRPNRILLVVNPTLHPETINAVNAAQVTIGADIDVRQLETPLKMIATKKIDRTASGEVYGWEALVEQVSGYDFDALAIATPIDIVPGVAKHYFKNGGVNPWGGVEAIASRLISAKVNKPVAHAPAMIDDLAAFNEVVDPRMAAEMVSICYLHCVLKGLHRAPQPSSRDGIGVENIDFLVSPWGCKGIPHEACYRRRIPIIYVRENTTCLNEPLMPGSIRAENYLEAAGIVSAMRAGVLPRSVRART